MIQTSCTHSAKQELRGAVECPAVVQVLKISLILRIVCDAYLLNSSYN